MLFGTGCICLEGWRCFCFSRLLAALSRQLETMTPTLPYQYLDPWAPLFFCWLPAARFLDFSLVSAFSITRDGAESFALLYRLLSCFTFPSVRRLGSTVLLC